MSPDIKMQQSMGQFQRLGQRMLLTPQLIQSVEMLQLPIMELSQKVDEMLEENPFLEVAEETVEGDEVATELAEQEWVEDPEAIEALKQEHPESAEIAEIVPGETQAEDTTEDFARVDKFEREDDFGPFLDRGPRRSLDDDPRWEMLQNTPNLGESLYEHLKRQIETTEVPERIKELALRLASSLDRDGYLRIPAEEALAPTDEELEDGSYSAPTPEEAKQALDVIRGLDPAGVGARDLKDCLLLQLKDSDISDSLVVRVVEEQLDNVLHNRLPKVASALRVDIEDVKKVVVALQRLAPFPGRYYSQEPPQYVRPDIVVRLDGDEYEVVINESFLPAIRVSNRYRSALNSGDEASKEFMRRKYQEAHQLRQNIEQRRNTLYRISRELVGAQSEFLEKGEAYLRPMQMQELAEELGLHVSTISRAVADKYIDTPVGVFPLRRFFSSGYTMNRADADPQASTELSNQAVMNMVTEIVEQEDKRHPLADQAIAKILKQRGIDIARRTVAKYREKTGILPARQRREY